MATTTTIKREASPSRAFTYTTIKAPKGALCIMTARNGNKAARQAVSIAGDALPCGIIISREAAAKLIRAARSSS
jgi:hypothetical protein